MADILKFRAAESESCLICGDKEPGHLQQITINRTKTGDNIISFCVCDECIAHMANEMVKYMN